MKREELVDFTDEQKDLVMSLYGKAISKKDNEIETLKSSNKDLQTKYTELETQVGTLNKTIEDNNKSLESLNSITEENKNLKADIILSKNNVKDEFSKFVKSEVFGNVNETNDFQKALDTYKKDNPQYFGDVVVKKVQTAPILGGGNEPQTNDTIMNNLLRNAIKK